MGSNRVLSLAFFVFMCAIGVLSLSPGGAIAQISSHNPTDEQAEEKPVDLQTPNYMNTDYGFGTVLPTGYKAADHEENHVWVLEVTSGSDQEAKAALSIERLQSGVTDVAGFWKAMKERDAVMERNITYERIASVAGTGAIQARVERMENGSYILAILWVWVHDGKGYTLTGYPPEEGDKDLARDLAKQLIDQFRWMTAEEIEAAKNAPPPPPGPTPVPHGREF